MSEREDAIKQGERQCQDLKDQIRRLQFDAEQLATARKVVEDSQALGQSQLRQAQVCQKVETLDAKLADANQQTAAECRLKERALEEAAQLQDLVSDLEQQVEALTQELREQQQNNDAQGSAIDQLNLQRKVYDERMELKDKEIKSILERERALKDQVGQMQKAYDKLEQTHIRFKAQEYDKVDVLKVNAELEGKVNLLQIDVETLVKERNALQHRLGQSQKESEDLKEQVRMHLTEQEFFRRTNEQQLTKFDQKFEDFQKELTFLNDENLRLKDKEKK